MAGHEAGDAGKEAKWMMERRRGVVMGFVACLIVILAGLAGWLVWQEKSPHVSRDYLEIPVEERALTENHSEVSEVKRESMEGTVGEALNDMEESQEAGGQEMGAEGISTGKNVEAEGSGEEGTAEGIAAEGAGNAAVKDTVLLFAGDVYLSDHVLNAYNNAGGIHGVLDEGIRREIAQADIFMVNQEFPFTDRGTAAEDKQYTFRLPPEKVSMFQEMGIDIVTLANNHILDFGETGLLDSCDTLDEAGILYVGAGKDLERARELKTITIGDKTIGFLGTSRVYMAASWAAGASHPGVFSTYDPTLPIEAIKAAREQCDYLVVYVHWGVERETVPKEYQRAMGRQYIDAGADLVVGSHPHVLQDLEYYNGKPIVYSLGNFVFGSSIPKTALLKVELGGEAWTEAEAAEGAAAETTEAEGQVASGGQTDTLAGHVKITMIPCTSSVGYTRLVEE